MRTVEDAYTHYVVVGGVPESVFWECDLSFLRTVAANKAAYDGWIASERERQIEEARNESRR